MFLFLTSNYRLILQKKALEKVSPQEKILARLQELGFSIALQREFVMTRTMAETFYRKHRDEEFFEALVAQMISGPSLVLALCSKDAVKVSFLTLLFCS